MIRIAFLVILVPSQVHDVVGQLYQLAGKHIVFNLAVGGNCGRQCLWQQRWMTSSSRSSLGHGMMSVMMMSDETAPAYACIHVACKSFGRMPV